MGEDERAALPRRIPHADGPRIPHGSRSPREPLRRPELDPAAVVALAQLRSAAAAAAAATGTPTGQAARTTARLAEPKYRGAFEPVRRAGDPVRQPGDRVRQASEPARQPGESLRRAGEPGRQASEPVRQAFEPLRLAGDPLRHASESLGRAGDPVRRNGVRPRSPLGHDAPGTPVPAQPVATAVAAPSGPPVTAAPSWPAVLATTTRLWLARRGHRPGRRLQLACGIVLILAIASAAGLVAARQGLGVASADGKPGVSGADGGSHTASQSASVRGLAAGWVAGQVGGNVTLACDPMMCTGLAARGFPAANLVPITPGATRLPSTDLVVATQAVRGYFGSRLARVYAPLVIASFGVGQAEIQIRQVAPYGAAAFQRQFRNGRAALRRAGAELLKNSRIVVSATARAALLAGRVDGRLLMVLPALAARQPIRVLGFAGTNPGAAPGVPMRLMLLGGSDPAGHLTASTYARSLLRFLDAQSAPYRPAGYSWVRQSHGPDALSVAFAAPSPHGL